MNNLKEGIIQTWNVIGSDLEEAYGGELSADQMAAEIMDADRLSDFGDIDPKELDEFYMKSRTERLTIIGEILK